MINNMVSKYMSFFNIYNDFSGWTGLNTPGPFEKASYIWVTKAGARFFPEGFSYNPNTHTHWEWGAVLNGGLNFSYKDKFIKVQKGSFYLFPPHLMLQAFPIGNPFVVWVEISGSVSFEALKKLGGKFDKLHYEKFTAKQVSNVLSIAKLLHERPPGFNLLVHSDLWAFLASSFYPEVYLDKKISTEMESVINYMNKNFKSHNITLDKLAKILSLSRETFRKRFKSETGESPLKYFLKLRIRKAKELLSNKDLTIKQIAFETGFSDQYYFSRLFKKFENISPTEFRKKFYPEFVSNSK